MALELSTHPSLDDFLLLFKGAFIDLVYILSIGDFPFRSVSILFFAALGCEQLIILLEDGLDLFIETVSTIAHIENLQSLFNSHSALESLVVHKELDNVKQLAWLETSLIRDTSLVHSLEFLFADIAIEIIINLLSKVRNM